MTQGLARFAVEQGQATCTIPFGLLLDLPGTFDETALFKRNAQTKPARAVGMAVFRAILVDRFFQAGFPRWQKEGTPVYRFWQRRSDHRAHHAAVHAHRCAGGGRSLLGGQVDREVGYFIDRGQSLDQ